MEHANAILEAPQGSPQESLSNAAGAKFGLAIEE